MMTRSLRCAAVLVCAAVAATAAFGAERTLTVTTAGDAFMVQKFPASYAVAPELKAWIAAGDARLVNFEATVNDGSCPPAAWSGGTWAIMLPEVFPDLLKYGFNGCGCANNHSLDYSLDSMYRTMKTLDDAGIPRCGIGRSLEEASAPAIIDTPNGKVAVISVTAEFHPDARAGVTTSRSPGRPGVNALRHKEKFFVTKEHLQALKDIAAGTYINGERVLNQREGFENPDAPGTFVMGGIAFEEAAQEGRTSWCNPNDLKRLTDDIARAREQADAVIVMAHSHQIRADRYTESDHYHEEFCRAAIDAGASAVIGGGTHQLKGIEFRKGRPIFYSLGDFVFQNNVTPSVPPDFCEKYGVPLDSDAKTALAARSKNNTVGLHVFRENFLSVVPKIEIVGGEVKRVTMLPIELHFAQDWSVNGLPRPASPKDAADIERTLARLSKVYGTEIVRLPDGTLEARPAAAAAAGPVTSADVVDLARELMAIPSVSANVREVNRALATLKAWLEERGVFCAVETDDAGRQALWASTRPGKVQDYVLCAHVDVVPAPDAMFVPKFENGVLRGRGASDCKGNAAVCAATLVDLLGKASVGCVFGTDEEIGGFITGLMVDRGYRPRKMVLVADLARLGLVYAHKGQTFFRLVAKGKGGHSSAPWRCDNALERLTAACAKLQADWVAAYPAAKEDDPWHDTLSLTLASAGSVPNRIPEVAEATVNLRYVAPGRDREVMEFIRKSTGLEVTQLRNSQPVVSDPNDPLLQRLLADFRAKWPERDISFGRMNGAADGRHFAKLGLPIVLFGADGGDAHGDAEWQETTSMQKLRELMVGYLAK